MRKFVFTDLVYKLFLIMISILFLFPQYYVKYPSLIDDGYDFLVVKNHSFFSIIRDGLLFESRTWPLRLGLKKIFYSIVGGNVGMHYLLYTFILATLMYLVYYVLLKIKVTSKVAKLASFLIILLPSTVENFYRLGTSEHFQVILLLLAFTYLNKKYYLSLVIVFISCFFKETSIFYLSFFPIYSLLIMHDFKKVIISFLPIIFYASIIFYKFQYVQNSYTNQAHFDIQNLFLGIKYTPYTFLFYFIVLFLAFIIFRKKTVLLLFSTILLVPYLFWYMHSYYYHLPLQIFSFILGIKIIFHYLNQKGIAQLIFLPFLFLFFNFSFKNSVPLLKYWHQKALDDGKLVGIILENNWSGYHVYSTVSGFESMVKISDYFTIWNNTPPKFIYPSGNIVEKTDFFDHNALSILSRNAENLFLADPNPKKIIIEEINSQVENENAICVSSILIEKSCKYKLTVNNH